MPHRSLPGSIFARLQDGLLLTGALIYRGIAVIGLRALEYAFTHETPEGQRHLRKPVLALVRVGYWMVGGVTTARWDSPSTKDRPPQN